MTRRDEAGAWADGRRRATARRHVVVAVVVVAVLAGLGAGGPPAAAQPQACTPWAGGTSLQRALERNACTEIQPGTYAVGRYLVIPDGHTLQGNPDHPREAMVLQAGRGWNGNGNEGVVNGEQPPHRDAATLRHFVIDAGGIATGAAGAGNMVVQDMVLQGGRCWGVAIVGPSMAVLDSAIRQNGADTSCPSPPGAGVYVAANGPGHAPYAPRVLRNEISHNTGPAVDIYNVWHGELIGNDIHDNSGWAAVSLLGSHWRIAGNTISHPLLDVGQPWLAPCATGPAGAHSAAVLLCQATVADGVSTTANVITDNWLSSWYGVLAIGNDEANPSARPSANTVTGNTIVATVLPCADDGEAVGLGANAWGGCTPLYF